jgi:hypothetical protein
LRAENAIRNVSGTETDIVFYFTTHNLVYWLIWTYNACLRTLRLKMGWSKSRFSYAIATSFNSVNNALANAVIDTVQPIDFTILTGQNGSAKPLTDLVKLRNYYRGEFVHYAMVMQGQAMGKSTHFWQLLDQTYPMVP